MRIYRNSIIITALLALTSFIGAFYFSCDTSKNSFWCNLLLGIFGSGVVTFITSIIGYRVERRRTFEGFWYTTKQILKNLNIYQCEWSLEQKIDFFLTFYDIEIGEWNRYYGDFCLMFDITSKNQNYIFQKIFNPIQDIYQNINSHINHFRWHKDGSGYNTEVMEKYIQEIENLIIENTCIKYDVPNITGGSENYCKVTRNKIVENIEQELDGKYYRLMYGSRKVKNNKESTKLG